MFHSSLHTHTILLMSESFVVFTFILSALSHLVTSPSWPYLPCWWLASSCSVPFISVTLLWTCDPVTGGWCPSTKLPSNPLAGLGCRITGQVRREFNGKNMPTCPLVLTTMNLKRRHFLLTGSRLPSMCFFRTRPSGLCWSSAWQPTWE